MPNSLALHDLLTPVGSLEAYIQRVNQIPMLTPEEEQAQGLLLYHHNDIAAAQRLILSHLRFVVRVARQYSGYGLAFADLIQEGNVGLMKAVRRFNPTLGVRLVSFAVHWIKAEIHEFILRNWRIVKVATTKAQRKLFFHLRSAKKRLGWFTAEEVNHVARDLGVSPEVVVEMENRMNVAHDVALEHFSSDEDDDGVVAPIQYLEDTHYAPEKQMEVQEALTQEQAIHVAITQLDARSRDIVQRRFLVEKKATLQELAEDYQVSPERIRQLEEKAINKLKKALALPLLPAA